MEKNFSIEEKFLADICGVEHGNLKFAESYFDTVLLIRGNRVKAVGSKENIEKIENFFIELLEVVKHKGHIDQTDLLTIANLISGETGTSGEKSSENGSGGLITGRNNQIVPKNPSQQIMIDQMNINDIIFSIGPAGTGKTYLAVAIAVDSLLRNRCSRIILTRPAVEAGESLGFLPGDFKEKIAPYLRPLYDALVDMLPREQLKRFIEEEIIEVVPLAYMRGRTLNNAFVILDEAQNASMTQMKMFLTRIGKNSKAVITGDITQIDLLEPDRSGLVHVQRVLQKIKGISFIYFKKEDVIRHRLVRDIIQAYEDDTK